MYWLYGGAMYFGCGKLQKGVTYSTYSKIFEINIVFRDHLESSLIFFQHWKKYIVIHKSNKTEYN